MTREAFLHAFDLRPGDPYDEQVVRRRFRALWKGRWFEDIRIEKEAAPNGGAPVGLRLSESLANSPESEAEREANAREAMRQNAGRLGAALGSLLPAPEPEAADDVRSD